MTDQQRYDAVGYVNPKLSTPSIDKLAARSTIFTTAYVQSPQCQPSRSAILTGRYPSTLKMWWNETALAKSERTIANCFRDVGYNTAYFGKIHLTDTTKDGYHALAGHFGFNNCYLLDDWVTKIDQLAKTEIVEAMATPNWVGNMRFRHLHHDDVVTEQAINYLKTASKYFAVISFHGPHPPYMAPVEHLRYQHLDEVKSRYYGAISWIDENIGRILEHVDFDNTIIVFMSDHGDMLGDHGLHSKGVYAYEGVVRIPLCIYVPNRQPIKYTHLTQAIDLFPTLIGLNNLSVPPGVQGMNLSEAMLDNIPVNSYVLSMIGYYERLRMIRRHQYKYWICGQTERLYDLENDPNENNNLIMNYDLANKMRSYLLAAMIDAEDRLPAPKIKAFEPTI